MALNIGSENSPYLLRYVDRELDELASAPAIAIDGPKAVGKTETVVRRSTDIYRLDLEEQRELVQAQLKDILAPHRGAEGGNVLCFDEWQYLPQIWDEIRHRVDEATTTRFLLTGSATPHAASDTHSGAGRILSIRMRPMSLAERPGTTPTIHIADLFEGRIPDDALHESETSWTVADYTEAICSTGLPGILNQRGRLRRQHISSYIQRVIDRDLPEQGLLVRKPQALRAWWRAYAAASSTTTAYNKILDAATGGDSNKISKDAALNYRETLSKLWLLDPVEAWLPNRSPFSKLTVSPKHQVADPGIAAALLELTPNILLSRQPGAWETFGQLFESLATLTVRSAGQAAEAHTYHLRTQGGAHEVDLVLERYDGKVIAFEVKPKPLPTDHDVRHLHWMGEQLGDRLVEKVVITTGRYTFRRPDGVLVVPLSLLG